MLKTHLMILSACKSQLDEIDLIEIDLHLLVQMRAGDVHLRSSSFRFLLFCTDYFYVKSLYFTFFSPKTSSICFIFHLMSTIFCEYSSVSPGS